MKKLLITLALTGALASSMLAEIDVDSSKESKGFCQGKHSNTGCFVGAEVGITFAQNSFDYGRYVQTRPSILQQDFIAVPINFIFGHQWYYAQNQGVRLRAHIGYTNYNSKMPNFQISGEANTDYTMSVYSHALQYGLDLAWVYDFIANETHSFGFDFTALGFEASTFLGNNASMPDANLFDNVKAGAYTKFAYSGGIGLHYFYKSHHQFFIEYRYRSYTNTTKTEFIPIKQGQERVDITLANTSNHLLALSYAYKF